MNLDPLVDQKTQIAAKLLDTIFTSIGQPHVNSNHACAATIKLKRIPKNRKGKKRKSREG